MPFNSVVGHGQCAFVGDVRFTWTMKGIIPNLAEALAAAVQIIRMKAVQFIDVKVLNLRKISGVFIHAKILLIFF